MSALMNEPFAPPPKTDFEVDIDGDQAQFFSDNGYLALDRVTTDEELEWLSVVYDQLLARPMSGYPDTYYDAVRPYGVRDAPILGQLLFPEQRVHKPARHGAATPWHQDEAYWDRLSYYAVGSWLPLDDVFPENGCMWFLPGSHLKPILRHRHMNDDPAIAVLELVDDLDTSAAVPCRCRRAA